MRLSSRQVKSMKCSNEGSCQWNSNNRFKGYFLNGSVFVVELDKVKETEKSSIDNVYLVCPSLKTI